MLYFYEKVSACQLFHVQYLSEANDVQTWLNEKKQLAASEDYGRAETVADKLLTKHKVINRVQISKMFVY